MKDLIIAESGKGLQISLTGPDGVQSEVQNIVNITEAKVTI